MAADRCRHRSAVGSVQPIFIALMSGRSTRFVKEVMSSKQMVKVLIIASTLAFAASGHAGPCGGAGRAATRRGSFRKDGSSKSGEESIRIRAAASRSVSATNNKSGKELNRREWSSGSSKWKISVNEPKIKPEAMYPALNSAGGGHSASKALYPRFRERVKRVRRFALFLFQCLSLRTYITLSPFVFKR